NMMSEDIRFSHYRLLAKAIQEEIKNGVDGIIIGHGTDTIALTAAALSFMLEHVPIPVILVGAQRSSDRGGSDARLNMLSAAYFIARGNFKGVALCMHETSNDNACVILPATKTKKLHTSRRDAFKTVNTEPLARVHYAQKKIDYIHPHPMGEQGKFITYDKFEEKVAIVKTYPNMFSHLIDALIAKKYKGIVLEGSGIGQAPTNIKEDLPIYNALQKFIKKGGTVVLTSNCVFGAVHPYIYKNCRRLLDIGVIFGKDMLTETAFIKLAWLLGNYPKKEITSFMDKNLRGEYNSRLPYQDISGR
ncbi:MAG: Glu-tRNA(Gln) amidotransferase subunit GatD, partial [Nanoarchaeota archaeon]